MKVYSVTREDWPEAVSDGLILPCCFCGSTPEIDYRVDDDEWARIAPNEWRLNVICLSCLLRASDDLNRTLEALQTVQVIPKNAGVTMDLELRRAYIYPVK